MTGEELAIRPVQPAECAVAFGIPTSEQAYQASRSRSGPYFATKKECRPFARYESMFLRPYRRAAQSMKRAGARVEPNLSLDLLGELFRSPEIHVVILFSHWGEESVEMDGGFARVRDIVERVPPGVAKIVDLTVCRCAALADALVREHPECLVRWTLGEGDEHGLELDPVLWLGLFRLLFPRLKRRPKPYTEAVNEIAAGARAFVSRR